MNRIKFLSKTALVASLSLALALTFSCSSSDNNESSDNNDGSVCSGDGIPFNENSQIYNGDGTLCKDSGVIKVRTYSDILINTGVVANGIVQLEPPTIPDEYLSGEYLDEESQKFCSSYTKGIKGLDGYFVLMSSNGDEIGHLVIGYKGDDGNKDEINYYYFSRANKITCDWPDGGGGARIEAEVGWNRIYYRRTKNTKERCTNNVTRKQVMWIIDKY